MSLLPLGEKSEPLCATHSEGGQRVLESLLEGEKLQYRLVDRRVETYATLVRTYGVIVLDAPSHVVAHLAFVVDPADTEREYPVGDAEAFNEIVALKLGILVVGILDGGDHLLHRLDILRLVGEATLEIGEYFCCFHSVRLNVGKTNFC